MNGWFCTSCKSLNARGSKRCYSCGLKQDFIPLGDALVPSTAAAAPNTSAPTSSPAPVAPAVVVSSRTGAPAGPFAAASAIADAGLVFAGDRVRRLRRPRRSRVLLLLALILTITGVTAAGVLSPPDWMRATAKPADSPNPAETHAPKDR